MSSQRRNNFVFSIYEDARGNQKSTKRPHVDNKENDKDAKKPKTKEEQPTNEKSMAAQLSADKVIVTFFFTS